MDDVFSTSGSASFDLENLNRLKKVTSLDELFSSITDIVVQELEKINWDDGEDKPLLHQSFMNDFASQQYVERNIRVRPGSGRQEEGDRKAAQGGFMDGDGEAGQDEENNKLLIDIEMNEQRRIIKEKKAQREKIMRIEEEKKKS